MVYFSKLKVAVVLGIVLIGAMLASPNLFDQKTVETLPKWLPHQKVSLGLDLQGGSHLLLEVKVDVVLKERLASLVDA